MQISQIQKNILAVARNEDPYDIFICYKETDKDGNRTKDSVFAQDIYDQLVQEKYKVFFSRITLEDKLGTEYEPYIFSALNSSKVMLVVGTTKENFEAVWVKNEWSRFLELLRKDKSKIIIPCYRDMNAYDLPDELSLFQSQDMNKIGFMQDLIRGIKKIINQTPEKQDLSINEIKANNYADERQTRFENLLINARRSVDENKWADTKKYCNLLKEEFPKKAIIENIFLSSLADIMLNKPIYIIFEWNKVFDLIEKYYDISDENKEEVLNRISEILCKGTFPKENINYNTYNSTYYQGIIVFNNKLKQLENVHKEEYIHKLISKHIQIIMMLKQSKRKFVKLVFDILSLIWFIGITYGFMSDPDYDFFFKIFSIFMVGILPYLYISKIIKLLSKDK